MFRFALRPTMRNIAPWLATVVVAAAAVGCNNSSPRTGVVAQAVHQSPPPTCTKLVATAPSSASRDTEIRRDQADTNFGTNDTAQVGIPQSANERRSLFYFDTSSIPSGAAITSATVTMKGGNASFGTIDVHTVLAPWSETSVTWNSLGTAYSPSPTTTFTDAGFSAGKTTFDIKPLVQQWVSGTPNNGMLLKKDASSPTSVATFKTRESSSPPELDLCYTPGSDPCAGAICKAADQCHVAGTCDPKTGQCSNPVANDGTACSDGNSCTQTDTCQAGACVGGNPVTCSASDQCHVAGTCDPKTGQCSNPSANDGTACNDGNNCTQTDACQAGACVGSNPVTCAASDQCHVAGTCNPTTGQCSNPAANDGAACNDGNSCTQRDTCQAGSCIGSSPVICAASDQCHVAGTCNPQTGQCSNPIAANGTGCSDGNSCTQTDTCQAGACVGANPVTCAASDQCHVAGTCNPQTGQCSNPVAANGTGCSDGNSCTRTDTCQAGACIGSNPVVCTASDQCHVAGTCNSQTGQCSNPIAANGTSCSDGNGCTQTDSCQAGACVGANPVTCAASDQCHVAGTCNPQTGQCSNPIATNGTSCSDGNSCTQTDSCQAGACIGNNPVTCAASDQCHVAGSCNPQTGQCSNPTAANGTACSDGNSCTQSDTCQSGACVGSNPVVCTASDQCHVAGTCNSQTGQCSNPIAANGTSCSDGNSCTQTDACQAGTCVGSNPVVCTASDRCHVAGTCNSQTGQCSNPIAANGTSCSDGNSCTQTDACQSGACVGGNPVVCAASDQCHVAGSCDPSSGHCSNPVAANGTVCSDGNSCTQTDACQSGACVGSNPVVCAASDQCHVAGRCDSATGQCSNPAAANGAACNDGNSCTQTDTCQSGTCVGSNAVACAASDQCHVAGSCDPTTGQCSNPAVPDGTTCTATGGPAICTAGTCTVTGPPCTPLDSCHVAGTRDPITGVCSNPPAANGTACDDGNACTTGETCQAGACGQPTSMTSPSFAKMMQLSTQAPYWSSVATGDFNGDTIPDVIAPQGIMLGNGDGTFQTPRNTVPGSASAIAAVGDFNRDGKLDVALEVFDGLTVALGNGDGTFQPPLPSTPDRVGFSRSFYATTAADFNGDGYLDIAAIDRSENPILVSILIGNGDGSFLHMLDYQAGWFLSAITTGDFNGDGRPDLAMTSSIGVDVLISNGDGTFKPKQSFVVDTPFDGEAIVSGDFNGDGKADLATNNNTSGVSVLLSNGDGTFLGEHAYATGGGFATSLTTADFNADGIADIVATHGAAVNVYLGKRDGTLRTAANFPIGISPGSVSVADFNRDGKPDILTGESYNVGPSVALSSMPDSCFGCTNPVVPDGARCNDGNVCTTGDTCRNHACTGSNLPDGNSCSTRSNAGGTCSAGTCRDACSAGFADCGGVCTGIVSDNQNCGGCGIACGPRTTCAGGKCVLSEILQGCSTTSPVTVVVKGSKATAYVANGHWDASFFPDQYGGVQVIPLEGGGPSASIGTPSMVNTCGANSVTGEVVCVANNTDVYTIEQTALTSTLHSGAKIPTGFTDGGGYNVGVAIDAAMNRAIISLGVPNYGFQDHAYQFLDLGTRTFDAPIPIGAIAAEQFVVDPVRSVTFAASEDARFSVLKTNTTQTYTWDVPGYSYFDSSAEDCQTGIVIGAREGSNLLTVADLTQASYSATTWSAPSKDQLQSRDAITVAQGSHLALAFDEAGSYFTVLRLPATSGSGVPTIVDYATSHIDGFLSSRHGIAAYVSPIDGKAYGVVSNFAGDKLATIDLQAVLDAPRFPINSLDPAEGYTPDVSGDSIALGLVKLLPILGHPDFVISPTANPNPTYTTSTNVSALGSVSTGESGLTYSWAADGPAPIVFTPNGTNDAKNSTATVSKQGSYRVTATLTDARGFTTSRDTYFQVVQRVNRFVATPATLSLATGDTASINLDGRDQFGAPYWGGNFSWSLVTGPTGGHATFANPFNPTTTVSFNVPGSYTIQAQASDYGLPTLISTITATVTGACTGGSCDMGVPDMGPPPDMSGPSLVVSAGSNVAITLPVASVTLNASVTDNNGQSPSGSVTTTWSKVSGPGTVVFTNASNLKTTATFGAVGVYDLRLTATQGYDNATGDVTVTVNPHGTTQGPPPSCPTPTVALSSPNDGSELTTRTDVIGSVSGGNWALQYVLGGDESSSPPVTICSGTGPVDNARLCAFDPTLLVNGTYSLRLTSTCDSGSSSASVGAMVTKNQKVGISRVSFNDISVPVAGLPIRVTRSYDSRNKGTSGDFGFGWNIDLGSSVRVEKSAGLGKHWVQTKSGSLLFPQYCLNPSRALFVTVTFPGGKVYRFQTGQDQPCQLLFPIIDGNLTFTPIAPTQGSLTTLGSTAFTVSGNVGPVQLVDSTTLDPLNPTQFELTTEDGTVYFIDQYSGLLEIDDRNGNVLSISPSGIAHSSGKSTAFVRDTQGRITSIVDPSGSFLSYTYDTAGNLATVKDRTGGVATFEYDPDHSLVAIKDPRGVQDAAYVYDSDGRLISRTDASGNSTVYSHDLDAQRDVTTDPLGNVTVYEYDADGNVVKQTDARGGVTARTFDANDNKLTETDQLGNTTTYRYDSSNNLIATIDPLGKTTTSTYNGLQQVLTSTDELGHTTTNTYDGQGNLLSTVDGVGGTTSQTYNAQGLQTSLTDARGAITTLEYDSFGNLTKQTDPLGHVTTFTYDANGHRITENRTRTVGTNADLLVTTYGYDAQGRQTTITYPDGTTALTTYNTIGKKASKTDQLGRTTTYAYDADGNLTKTTYADGTADLLDYDAAGRVTTATDRGGRRTSYVYDALGHVTTTTYADGTSTTSIYDGAGRQITSSDELGSVTSYAYDANGRRTSVTDASGHTIGFGFDAAGNKTSITDPLGHITTTTYDADNRPTTTTYPDGTFSTIEYDAEGNKTAQIDAAGVTTKFAYDLLGRLVHVTDALGGVTSYGYDEVGNRVSQTDAKGHTTLYANDRLGRLTKRTLPLAQTETLTYDAAGNIQSRTDFNGRTTLYSYDSSNRLTGKTPDLYFDTLTVTFSYTPTGKLATVVDATGVTSYVYDHRDRVLTKTAPAGKLTYTYDAAGNRLTMRSDAGDGVAVDYAWDASHRLTSVTDRGTGGGATTYSYDAASNLDGYAYPNGVAATMSYDVRNRVLSVSTTAGNQPLSSYAYTFGPAGNRLSATEGSGRTVNWSYDNLYRLTAETIAGATGIGTNGAVTYGYDSVGNRTARTSTVAKILSSATTCDPNDRLNSDSYDADGNTTTSNASNYAYDFEDRLASVNTNQVVLGYDGQGMLVSRTLGNSTTNYLVDQENPTGYPQIVEERVGGSVIKVLVFGPRIVSQRQKTNGNWVRSYYVHDGHQDVRLLTDASGTVTDSYDYDAFGNVLYSTGATPNDYRYTSERFDSSVGLEYLRARYMNPNTGRFLNADTAVPHYEDPMSLNRYLYGSANPINRSDPQGLSDDDHDAALLTLVVPYLVSHAQRPPTVEFLFQGQKSNMLAALKLPDISPDILNFANQVIPGQPPTFLELKPLSYKGLKTGRAQRNGYERDLGPAGFFAETWEPLVPFLPAYNGKIYLFTSFPFARGLLFYTDSTEVAAAAAAAVTVSQLSGILNGLRANTDSDRRGLFGMAQSQTVAAVVFGAAALGAIAGATFSATGGLF
jgi:RHS repeat-associated protein